MRKVEVKKVSFGISLDKPIYDAVQALAAADQRSMAFLIQDAVLEYLARRQGDGTPGGSMLAEIKPGTKSEDIKLPVVRFKTLGDALAYARERSRSRKLNTDTATQAAPKSSRGD